MGDKPYIAQLPPFSEPILGPDARMTLSWRRFFEGVWNRTGGFDDGVWLALTQALVSSTAISSLTQSFEGLLDQVSELRAAIAAKPSYDEKIDELRAQVSAVRQASDSLSQQQEVIRQENQIQIDQALALNFLNYSASIARLANLTTSDVPEGTNLYYTDARSRAALSASAPLTYNSTTGALAITLATVATTGAYSDLIGTPTLGTAAAQNIGTSGANVPLLSTANTWTLAQTAPAFNVGVNQVVSARRTGWVAATGTATRTTFDTTTVTLPDLAERVKALVDDLTTHGLIGT